MAGKYEGQGLYRNEAGPFPTKMGTKITVSILGCDDEGEVLLDGQLVAAIPHQAPVPYTIVLDPIIDPGLHTLEIMATDYGKSGANHHSLSWELTFLPETTKTLADHFNLERFESGGTRAMLGFKITLNVF